MSINDLINQGIEIQGKLLIKQHDEGITRVLHDTDNFKPYELKEEIRDIDIKYMYCENDRLIIEV